MLPSCMVGDSVEFRQRPLMLQVVPSESATSSPFARQAAFPSMAERDTAGDASAITADGDPDLPQASCHHVGSMRRRACSEAYMMQSQPKWLTRDSQDC